MGHRTLRTFVIMDHCSVARQVSVRWASLLLKCEGAHRDIRAARWSTKGGNAIISQKQSSLSAAGSAGMPTSPTSYAGNKTCTSLITTCSKRRYEEAARACPLATTLLVQPTVAEVSAAATWLQGGWAQRLMTRGVRELHSWDIYSQWTPHSWSNQNEGEAWDLLRLSATSSLQCRASSHLSSSRVCAKSSTAERGGTADATDAATTSDGGSAGSLAGVKETDTYASTRPASAETTALVREKYAIAVGVWLLGCCGMMFGMVCLGGYTRLTKSGLSMTDWRFQGTWLPASEESWEEQFTKYKKTPEYREVHYGMSLEDFKEIYLIEWLHRMLGRATGGLFIGGLAIFAAVRALSPRLIIRLTCIGSLGAAQGLVGWWMVKSGLSEPKTEVKTPRVSPYRLAAHLVTAMAIYCLTLWQALSVLCEHSSKAKFPLASLKAAGCSAAAAALRVFQIRAAAAGALICTTLASGAFVAGNDAGRVYNTWPKMHDRWVPPEVYATACNWRKVFENLAVVQFNHRILAYASIAVTGLLYMTSRALPLPAELKKTAIMLPIATALQALLGIATLLYAVPMELGVMHQAGGMTVLTVLLYLLHTASRLRLHP